MRPYGLSWALSEKVSPMSTMYEPAGNVIPPVLPADFTAVSAADVPAGMSSPLAVPATDNASTMARATITARRNLSPPPVVFPFPVILISVSFQGRNRISRPNYDAADQNPL